MLSPGSSAGAQVWSLWALSAPHSPLPDALGYPGLAASPRDALGADFCVGISRAQMAKIRPGQFTLEN